MYYSLYWSHKGDIQYRVMVNKIKEKKKQTKKQKTKIIVVWQLLVVCLYIVRLVVLLF